MKKKGQTGDIIDLEKTRKRFDFLLVFAIIVVMSLILGVFVSYFVFKKPVNFPASENNKNFNIFQNEKPLGDASDKTNKQNPITDIISPRVERSGGGGGGGGGGGSNQDTTTPTPTCNPSLTCANYQEQCGTGLSNGCSNSLDCSNNCISGETCFSGECMSSELNLPETFETAYNPPTGGKTWNVHSGDNLQSVINNASLGDMIILDANATFFGNFKLPNKTGNGWIYIISSELNQLPEGDRVAPADSVHMAKLEAYPEDGNCYPLLLSRFGAHNYRFAGIEFFTRGCVYNLILLGMDWRDGEALWNLSSIDHYSTSVSQLPYNITFDRCYIHSLNDTVRSRTGILADGRYIAVIDSYLSNFKDSSDAQAIWVYNGKGPYKIINNYLEGTGENFMSGGTDPVIQGLIPSDFEIRGNYFYKPLKWKFDDTSNFGTLGEIAGLLSGDGNLTFNASNGNPFSTLSGGEIVSLYTNGDIQAKFFGYIANVSSDGKSITVGYWTNFNNHITPNGTQNRVRVNPRLWCIKNHFELKNAQRVYVSGNIFENNWYLCGGQRGTSLVLTPRNQDGESNWSVVQDLTYINNIVRHIGSFTRIAGEDDIYPSEQTKRILIKNNLVEDINRIYDYSWGIGLSTGNVLTPIYNLEISNNLILHNGTGSGFMWIGDSGNIAENLAIENNIFTHADYGIAGNNVGMGTRVFDTYTKNYSFKNNLIINRPGDLYYLSPYYPIYPGNNTFVNDISDTGFTDYNNQDYSLLSSSIGKNAGTDGKDIGPDYGTIDRDTNCTRTGKCREVNVFVCGNNIIESGEICDGTNLNQKTCLDYGYNAGNLSCSPGCSQFDLSGCRNEIRSAGALIVNHTSVNDFDSGNIPQYYLEKAKEITIHYAHTSHGSQIVSGLSWIEANINQTLYNQAIRTDVTEGLPPIENPPALRIYDGNPPETYINPDDYWDNLSSANALTRTIAVADTGKYNFSMWSWCGQQAENSIATVQRYLDNMNYLESKYPNMRFIYITGHLGSSNSEYVYSNGVRDVLERNNQIVRNYSRNNNKILFDFADIEAYNGTSSAPCLTNAQHLNYNNLPVECDWPAGGPSCAHSLGVNCVRKAKAFWWMMARLAGWDGTPACDSSADCSGNNCIKGICS